MGNPVAKGVLFRERYISFVPHAERLINIGLAQEHKGVAKAVSMFDDWMTGKNPVYCQDVFIGQRAKGVSAKELLAEILAVFLYYQANRSLWHDLPSLRQQLGISVLRYRKASPRQISYQERKNMGAFLWYVFRQLLETVYAQFKAEAKEAKERTELFKEPFQAL